MKKIGIITTYFATNYGAMLQPFAMKKTLEQMGYDVEMIRYCQSRVWSVYNPFSKDKMFRRNVGAMIFHWLTLPWQLVKRNVFYKYMERCVSGRGFDDTVDKGKDYYIFGSDQIWNPAVTDGFDDVYFGNFETKKGAKKIAYAASAEDIPYTVDNIEYLKRNLSGFDSIAVREKQLAEQLYLNTGIEGIQTVIDPTLLLNPSQYEEIGSIDPLKGEKYVLFYKIRNSMSFAEKVYEYACSIGAKMLILSSWIELPIIKFAMKHKGVVYKPSAGVEEFLGAVKNAECIFTPSFHGVVFPILFHKPFYSLVLDDKWNTRAYNLLESVGLLDRLLDINGDIRSVDIDYQSVDNHLLSLRDKSLSYLREALSAT